MAFDVFSAITATRLASCPNLEYIGKIWILPALFCIAFMISFIASALFISKITPLGFNILKQNDIQPVKSKSWWLWAIFLLLYEVYAEKSLSDFYHNVTKSDRHNSICKDCQKLSNATNKARKNLPNF